MSIMTNYDIWEFKETQMMHWVCNNVNRNMFWKADMEPTKSFII
jgi:hypothetical protein